MKVRLKLGIITVLVAVGFSCSKAAKDAIDCLAEALLVSMSHSTDAANSKKINFVINYSGTYTVSSVQWDYGDGQSQTITGLTATHTYAAAGTYTVKTKVTVKNGSSNCTVEPTKTVVIP